MLNRFKKFAIDRLAKNGRKVSRFPLAQYLFDLKIDSVLDVGANVGQYAKEIRFLDYRGQIESFEPLPDVIKDLNLAAERDSNWRVHPFALGAENCMLPINISNHSPSSSFLKLDSDIISENETLATVSSTQVAVKKLDDVYNEVCGSARNVYLKIDTQGFEKSVIEGASLSLKDIRAVQMELALVANYESETLVEEMMSLMRGSGFTPWWIMDGFRNPDSQQMYQAEVFFVKKACN